MGAQRKHFPSVNWLISYTKYMQVLEPYFNNMDDRYGYLRNQARTILQQEDNLSEIVQLVGKESLSEDQKVIMEVAKLIREDFLAQNAFTEHDYTCPITKTALAPTIQKVIDTKYVDPRSKVDFIKKNYAEITEELHR